MLGVPLHRRIPDRGHRPVQNVKAAPQVPIRHGQQPAVFIRQLDHRILNTIVSVKAHRTERVSEVRSGLRRGSHRPALRTSERAWPARDCALLDSTGQGCLLSRSWITSSMWSSQGSDQFDLTRPRPSGRDRPQAQEDWPVRSTWPRRQAGHNPNPTWLASLQRRESAWCNPGRLDSGQSQVRRSRPLFEALYGWDSCRFKGQNCETNSLCRTGSQSFSKMGISV